MNLQVSIPKVYTCINKCPYCISNTHTTAKDKSFETLSMFTFAKELEKKLTATNIYTSVVITGENEPLQQEGYVWAVLQVLKKFPSLTVEFVTTGVFLNEYLKSNRPVMKDFDRIDILSLSTLGNAKCDLTHMKKSGIDFKKLAKRVKKRFKKITIRTTFLETKFLTYDDFDKALSNKYIDQITIKHLQGENIWIERNKSTKLSRFLDTYFKSAVKKVGKRFTIYEINGKSVFVDKDCQTPSEETYHVMRSDGKIYKGWQTTKPLERKRK